MGRKGDRDGQRMLWGCHQHKKGGRGRKEGGRKEGGSKRDRDRHGVVWAVISIRGGRNEGRG